MSNKLLGVILDVVLEPCPPKFAPPDRMSEKCLGNIRETWNAWKVSGVAFVKVSECFLLFSAWARIVTASPLILVDCCCSCDFV